jgi:hypothetical protein
MCFHREAAEFTAFPSKIQWRLFETSAADPEPGGHVRPGPPRGVKDPRLAQFARRKLATRRLTLFGMRLVVRLAETQSDLQNAFS